jgi:hypothetical protein
VQSSQDVIAAVVPTAQVLPTLTATVTCPSDWYNSKDKALVEACSKLKEITSAQQRVDELATMTAQPYYQTIPGFVPQVLLPPPDYVKDIHEMKHDPYAGAWPQDWRGATSVWRDGAVPNVGYTEWSELYVIARPGNGAQSTQPPTGDAATTNTNPTLETSGFSSVSNGTDVNYGKRWICPQAVGAIYITNIVNPELNIPNASTPYPGLQSVVYFKTETGQTGNFNMATEAWTFDPASKLP